ncbi:hypothetical protein K491DRAFT_695376 [Lophiostoma macrostomum CBS 122681]|uniref:DnaJ homologue subfamily C member 28 conserved domain-containing protein n=1 Tax=Lophiostoma macrostomum CBS 122681 TaxID=1314788 RepID=A0A6A6T298_9PLEO|nr:hypothetical protein K491DRAFT_695376 [Lophiostoma macrostomum CBS 122681]
MPASPITIPYICARCIRAKRRIGASSAHSSIRRTPPVRTLADTAPQRQEKDDDGFVPQKHDRVEKEGQMESAAKEQDEGAMTQRLRSMSEEAIESGGRTAQKAVSEAGFNEDLKKQLEERIASANFRAEHRGAFAEAEAPSYAGRGYRDVAAAGPWSGEESIHDANLRMLNDAYKPMRVGRGARMPGPAAPPPKKIDTGRGPSRAATGTRLANARDRSGLYSSIKDSDADEAERQKRFQELKDRFSPNARSIVPGTIQGLASLANERIEDAIQRGQFKNLPRGQQIERDYTASSPFLDTTEYFMNKIIQKQEIVPPWIEKQQELVSTANKFRARLRNDWKRHAARMIASKGGTLQEQMRKAEAYARAEVRVNPPKRKNETLNAIEEDGHVSQISLSGELNIPPSSPTSTPTDKPITETVIAQKPTLADTTSPPNASSQTPTQEPAQTLEIPIPSTSPSTSDPTPPPTASPTPFRDPSWESTEHSYHTLAIADLNSKTRSYNLQAPDLAKKPYFSLQRELNACYADVAPQLAEAIQQRALAPRKVQGFGVGKGAEATVLDRLVGEKVRVRDERVERRYGFRQFWKDVWGG